LRKIRVAIKKDGDRPDLPSLGVNDKSNDTPEGRNPLPYGRNICIGEILTLRLGERSYRSVVQFWDHLSRDYPGSRLREGFCRERDPCTSTKTPLFFWSATLFPGQSSFGRVYDKLMVFRGASLAGLTKIQIGNCLVLIRSFSTVRFESKIGLRKHKFFI